VIDTNVNMHQWPFRRLAAGDPADLVGQLRKKGVTQAWTGSLDGLLDRDITAVNARLAADCRRHGPEFLLPFGSINPMLPDWEGDLRRCREQHRMPGIRLHPNYHGYKLNHPAFPLLLRNAADSNLLVQLVFCMEDERTQHPLVRVPNVDLAPLPGVLRDTPNLRLMLLNWKNVLIGEEGRFLARTNRVSFDFAMLEGVGGVERLRKSVPIERIVFGSHFPLFYFDSALLKVKESALEGPDKEAVLDGNAHRLLGGSHDL